MFEVEYMLCPDAEGAAMTPSRSSAECVDDGMSPSTSVVHSPIDGKVTHRCLSMPNWQRYVAIASCSTVDPAAAASGPAAAARAIAPTDASNRHAASPAAATNDASVDAKDQSAADGLEAATADGAMPIVVEDAGRDNGHDQQITGDHSASTAARGTDGPTRAARRATAAGARSGDRDGNVDADCSIGRRGAHGKTAGSLSSLPGASVLVRGLHAAQQSSKWVLRVRLKSIQGAYAPVSKGRGGVHVIGMSSWLPRWLYCHIKLDNTVCRSRRLRLRTHSGVDALIDGAGFASTSSSMRRRGRIKRQRGCVSFTASEDDAEHADEEEDAVFVMDHNPFESCFQSAAQFGGGDRATCGGGGRHDTGRQHFLNQMGLNLFREFMSSILNIKLKGQVNVYKQYIGSAAIGLDTVADEYEHWLSQQRMEEEATQRMHLRMDPALTTLMMGRGGAGSDRAESASPGAIRAVERMQSSIKRKRRASAVPLRLLDLKTEGGPPAEAAARKSSGIDEASLQPSPASVGAHKSRDKAAASSSADGVAACIEKDQVYVIEYDLPFHGVGITNGSITMQMRVSRQRTDENRERAVSVTTYVGTS